MMEVARHIVSIVLLTACCSSGLKQIPEYINICDTQRLDFDECVTNTVEDMKPHLARGIPELNIPTLEPLLLNDFLALQGAGIKIGARDVRAFGCSDFKINRMKVNLDEYSMQFGLDFPLLFITAKYRISGRILLLPIYGNGAMTGNFTKCKGDVNLQGEVIDRDGERYFNVKDLLVKIHVGKGSLQLDNLFGGDKLFGNVVNNALNSNFDTFIEGIAPSIEQTLAEKIKEIANQVVSTFTYDQLFPGRPRIAT